MIYAAFDTETTGLGERCTLLELAIVLEDTSLDPLPRVEDLPHFSTLVGVPDGARPSTPLCFAFSMRCSARSRQRLAGTSTARRRAGTDAWSREATGGARSNARSERTWCDDHPPRPAPPAEVRRRPLRARRLAACERCCVRPSRGGDAAVVVVVNAMCPDCERVGNAACLHKAPVCEQCQTKIPYFQTYTTNGTDTVCRDCKLARDRRVAQLDDATDRTEADHKHECTCLYEEPGLVSYRCAACSVTARNEADRLASALERQSRTVAEMEQEIGRLRARMAEMLPKYMRAPTDLEELALKERNEARAQLRAEHAALEAALAHDAAAVVVVARAIVESNTRGNFAADTDPDSSDVSQRIPDRSNEEKK